MFEIGKKVVCIEGRIWHSEVTEESSSYGPKKHEIVTIFGVEEFRGDIYLTFSEYPINPEDGKEPYFWTKYFRPLEGFPDQHEFSKDIFDRQERIEILQPDYA